MSNRFHSKWHRASHHTYKNPAILDAGWDPIASNDVPFSGDFVMSPRTACLSRISGDTVVTEDIYGMEYITGGEDPGRKITIHPEIDLAGSAVSSNDLHVRGVEYIYNSVSGEETALTITGSIDINPVAGEDPEDPEVTGTAGGIYIHDGFFTMTGNSTQSGDSVQYGDATQTGDYTQTGDHTQTGDYAITGDFTQEGNYVITGSITADGSGAYMYISGADSDGYGLKVVNDFWVGGGSVFDGDVTISGNLKVKKSTILESTLGVSGQTTLGDKTVIEKNGIEVSGNSIFKNNVNISGDVTTDGNLYVTGSGPSAGSAYFKSISATEATIVSALINEVDISASESNGYIMKTPNPQGKKIPNPMSISPGVNNFYLSGDTLYSNSWGYFEGELKTASALYADGPVTFADALNVSAIATFDNEIKAASSITTNKNLYVTGNAKVGAFGSFGTYVSAAGSDDNGYGLIIEKNANIKGNTNIGGTLVVTGATTLNTLTATGAADFDSTLNVDGATTLNGGVTVKTSPGNKSMTFDGEKIYRKNGTQAAGTFLFPSYGGTLVARPNSPLPPSGNIPMFDEYGNIVDSGNNAADKANSASLADPYESDHSSAYVVGDYVTHEGSLYKCKTDTSSPPGEWDDNNWDPVAVTDEIGGGGDRIVSRNGRTEVVANQDGTTSIIDNEGQKGLNIPEGFSFNGISFEESGLVAFSGPYKLNGAPSNAWFWLPPGVDPSTWEYGTTTPAHIFLGGTSESEPVAVFHNGFMPLYAISGWNTDNPTLTRSQSVPYLPEDITVAMVPLEKTVATVDQIPIDTVSHQELDDALFNKVSQNAQFRMSIKDDGKVVISGCRYRSANSTTQPFSNTYCVVSSETSLFDGSGGKIDFKIFNSTNDELLYRVVGYATGNWTVLQNNLTSEAASYLPNVGGNIQFPIIITTNPENKVLEVYLTGSGATLHPWSNFTSWADSKTKTLATLQNIAPDFSMDSTYEVGDYVTYDGSLWKCKVAVTTAGQWTESDNWEQFIVMDEINSKIGDINSVLDSINGEAI